MGVLVKGDTRLENELASQKDPKWKRFEALVAKVQSSFSPDAEVRFNEKVRGRHSGVLRQLDIVVRRNIGQFQIFIVVDCKDYSDPVDVKDIEEFIGLLEDVGANKGAMVAANGFTEAAKTRGGNSGIDLYRLVDAEQHDWQSYVSIPVACDFRGLGLCRFKIGGSDAMLQELASQDVKLIPLFDEDHQQIGTPLTILWERWNRREIPIEPGLYLDISVADTPVFIQASDGHFERIEIMADVNVMRNLYFGQLPLTKITGFRDEVSGHLLLPGNTEIITDWIDTIELERRWLKIPCLEALAIKPVMILTAFDHYPTYPSGEPSEEE